MDKEKQIQMLLEELNNLPPAGRNLELAEQILGKKIVATRRRIKTYTHKTYI